MTITSKYDGQCKRCGGRIRKGDRIDWSRETGARHIECPEHPEDVAPSYGQSFEARRGGESCADCGRLVEAGHAVRFRYPGKALCHLDCTGIPEPEPAPYPLRGGSGYGCQGWTVGQIVRVSDRLRGDQEYPEYLCVIRAKSAYVHDDGMCFGVGDESGYVYSAECREATEAEAAPHREAHAAAQQKREAKARLAELANDVRSNGERPEGDHRLDGDRLLDTQNIYGGGDWWVIDGAHIWYVQNNGADGDCWAYNNVRTGGAGAIGWRVPRTDELEAELRALASIAGGRSEVGAP